MISKLAREAVSAAVENGWAFMKFLSPNDTGATGTHQSGVLIPKTLWQYFTPQAPTKGVNSEHPILISWQNGENTESMVKWYGRETRSEYRITRFQRKIPFFGKRYGAEYVGSLLMMVKTAPDVYRAFVFDADDDVEEIQSSLGVEMLTSWTVYDETEGLPVYDENSCLEKALESFVMAISAFPSGDEMTQAAFETLKQCIINFDTLTSDERLMRSVKAEYQLFRLVENKVEKKRVAGPFDDIERFLEIAKSIDGRRKSRAGRALENQLHYILLEADVPHEMRAKSIQGDPDCVVPSAAVYHASDDPDQDVAIIGIKTTCKDRWRQVLEEAPKVKQRLLFTTQQGMSKKTFDAMVASSIRLVVPQEIHPMYKHLVSGRDLWNTEQLIDALKALPAVH